MSGCIFWTQISREPDLRTPSLANDIRCDVAIIGAGISGALAAYYLTREGIHTAIVDRRRVGLGSTAASTGLLQYEIDTPLVELIGKIGRDAATAAYRASAESLSEFEPLVADLGDRCGLTPRHSLYLASAEKDVQSLHAECAARQSVQIDVKFLDRDTLRHMFNLERPAALWSGLAFEVDPYRLTRQLIRRSLDRGLKIFTDTEILRYQSHDHGATLCSAAGAKIEAAKVIIAAGYETMGMLPQGLCKLASTYALCSQPLHLPFWRGRALIWESARPYLYARSTEDGRVMIGGEDEDIIDASLRDRLIEQKTQTLCRRFSELFPQIEIHASCAWAGTFAQTKDGLPFIGTLRQYPHFYFALGYGGNGITFSLIAAQIIRDSFLGRPNSRGGLFGFDR